MLVKRLAAISAKLSSVKSNRDHVLRELLSEVVLAPTFQLPLSPYMVCAGLNVDKCRVLGSAKAPLWLEFRNAVAGAAPHVVIFKTGDDLRQDQLTLQLLRSMDALWRARGLDLRMSPYGCVATARHQGFIEVVPQSATLSEITRDERFRNGAPLLKSVRKLAAAKEAYYGSDALLKWLTRAARERAPTVTFGPPGSFRHAGLAPPTTLPPPPKWRTARRREEVNPLQEGSRVYSVLDHFVRSLAGYSVATRVLGVGDRHNDNIMVASDGRYFHVDFGHFLGHFKSKFGVKRESASSFVLTPHMETVLGGRGAGYRFRRFEELCVEAFVVLRNEADHLMILLMLMVDSGIPELSGLEDVAWVQRALMVEERDDSKAAARFLGQVDSALDDRRTRSMHAIHSLVHTS